jgi:hypothetical protein
MKTSDFRTSAYFSSGVIFFGVILAFIGLWVIINQIIVGTIILGISVIIFSTHYRLNIDFAQKTFHDYVWILGIKHGEKGKFENLEYIFINKSKVSQTMSLKAVSTTLRKDVFDGYLKFSDGSKIHLMTMDDKADVIQKLKTISHKLNLKVIDYSGGEAKEI